jgi:hypothetical protein
VIATVEMAACEICARSKQSQNLSLSSKFHRGRIACPPPVTISEQPAVCDPCHIHGLTDCAYLRLHPPR